MAGVKHFYVGTYVEGSTPGDPSEYYKFIMDAQRAFKNYFSTEREETDAEIMFVQNYTDYATGYGEVPLFIGTKSGSGANAGMPKYCQNLVYTSLAWERHKGTITIAHRSYYDSPLVISPVDLDHGTITIRGISFYRNPPDSGNAGTNVCNYLSASTETTVIPIVFENCRFGSWGTCGGSCMNMSTHNKKVSTFNGEALVICKACVFDGTHQGTVGKCLNITPPAYVAPQPLFVGYNCLFRGSMTSQIGGVITVQSASNMEAHDALQCGIYNSYICCNIYQGMWDMPKVQSNCEFINCGFWRCAKPVDGTFEMINTWLFNCPEQDWKAASKLTNCATDLSSFGQATASNCKYDLNPDEQFYSYGKYGLLKFFPKEGSDLTTGATTDVLKDFSIYVYGGLAPEQYDPIGTGRPLR